MLDGEKVIKELENNTVATDKGYVEVPLILFANVIYMLKKQEAKQIVRKQCKKEHEDGSIDYFAEWYCPHCNLLILRGFDNPSIKFCYKCGKPISWKGR